MLSIQTPARQKRSENTISLINIVFLMLIFFLIAGQLSPPVDTEVKLINSQKADLIPPPDALFAHENGETFYQGKAMTLQDFVGALNRSTDEEGSGPTVLLAADRTLPAIKLMDLVNELYGAGAQKVQVITTRADR